MSTQANKFQQREIILFSMLSEAVAAAMYFSAKYDSDELFFRATHDSMTGLANRALFMDKLREVVASPGRELRLSGLLILDMDGLKQINDTYGHRIGDAVILEFAHRLKKATRETDTAARLGDDEFGVILTSVDNPESVSAAVHRIDLEMNPLFDFESLHYQLKASIGKALIPQDGIELEMILDIADQRMYAMKLARKS